MSNTYALECKVVCVEEKGVIYRYTLFSIEEGSTYPLNLADFSRETVQNLFNTLWDAGFRPMNKDSHNK